MKKEAPTTPADASVPSGPVYIDPLNIAAERKTRSGKPIYSMPVQDVMPAKRAHEDDDDDEHLKMSYEEAKISPYQ
jgi:hypothetical protein